VIEILSAVSRRKGCEYVCPGRQDNRPYGGLPRAWRGLVTDAGLPGVTLHTLRHSFASVAADLGYAEATIGALLGHASGTVTGRYTHVLDAVLIAAADRVATTVEGYMIGDLGEQMERQPIVAAA
jgi:integrase